jgi:ATP-dependent DNA helicase PIF1
VKFLNSLNISGVPPHRLHLQLGCPVVLLRNLSFGLANGTRMVVTELMEHCIHVQVVTGPLRGNKVLLPRLKVTPSDAEDYPFTLRSAVKRTSCKESLSQSVGDNKTYASLSLDNSRT